MKRACRTLYKPLQIIPSSVLLLLATAPAFCQTTEPGKNQILKNDPQGMSSASGKLLTDMIDTTTVMGKNMLSIYNKFGDIGFSGYMQPQFQYSESKGNINSYQGGTWGANVNNRFRLRRGRLRADYSKFTPEGKPSVYFVLQFDGTEQGVNIRDMWGRYYENKWELFHFSVGMMARPFGYEVLYSSLYRESPERGRMSQIIMNTERDLGFMLSFNPRKANARLKWLNIDAGIYNGQGLTGPMEYDSHKDIVVRASAKRQTIKKLGGIKVSGGVSGYFGGITSQNAKIYTMQSTGGQYLFAGDSSESNIGRTATRRYFGADIQIVIPNRTGQTEFRAEYIRGQQTATASTTTTPGTYPTDAAGSALPLYTRPFDGAYFYLLQNLGSWQHQLIAKCDWYDPNRKVKGNHISVDDGFSAADIRYTTFGLGYIYYMNSHLKFVIWVDKAFNEKTAIDGYRNVAKTGIITFRSQFSF